MSTQTTITTTPHPWRPRLIATLLAAGIVCALAFGAWSVQRDSGRKDAAPNPTTIVTAPAPDPDASPVTYLIGSDADRDVLQAFTAEFNRDRLRRGLPALADEALLRTTFADAGAAGTYVAFLTVWREGRAQALRVADLR